MDNANLEQVSSEHINFIKDHNKLMIYIYRKKAIALHLTLIHMVHCIQKVKSQIIRCAATHWKISQLLNFSQILMKAKLPAVRK